MIDLEQAVLTDEDGTPPPEKTRKPRSDAGKPRGPRGPRGKPAALKQLADELLVPWGMFATGTAMAAPTMSAVMLARGEKTMDALVSVAAKHPRMLKALQKGAESAAVAELAQTGFLMILAGMLDFGRIPPTHPIAEMTKLSELYAEAHPDNSEDAATAFARGMPANMVPFPMNGTPHGMPQ